MLILITLLESVSQIHQLSKFIHPFIHLVVRSFVRTLIRWILITLLESGRKTTLIN
jgi:hypothetical protein